MGPGDEAGAYTGPNAVISKSYAGFKVVWAESVVQPYSSGVPLYWAAYMRYTNITMPALRCPGNWVNASFVSEHMSGGNGDDGTVSAEHDLRKNPHLAVLVAPGGTYTSTATFHNVPWPGSAVAITWSSAGTSRNVHPFFASGRSSPPKGNNNWNGYLRADGYDNTVLGDWTVPRDTCRVADNGATASPWIGLGGLPSPNFSPLVDIGARGRNAR